MACINMFNDWRTPIYRYLTEGELPDDPVEAKKIKTQGARFTIVNGALYNRAFTMPLLKCLGPQEAEFTLSEVRSGAYGEHLGAKALAAKILQACFF